MDFGRAKKMISKELESKLICQHIVSATNKLSGAEEKVVDSIVYFCAASILLLILI